jgi:hypothetical protein
MEIINEPKFNKIILENIGKMSKKSQKDFLKIKSSFDENKMYLLGGFVRDSILKVLYGYDFPINDLDLLVEDINFEKKINKRISYCGEKNISRFGGMKLKYKDGFSTDVFSMKNIFFLKENPHLEKNLENVLKGVDITTSAFAYNLGKNEIYSHPFALKDINNMSIGVLNDYSISVSTICRLIIHSDKMKFKLDKSAINYIKHRYKNELDIEIKKYLDYKESNFPFFLIKNELDSIVKSH